MKPLAPFFLLLCTLGLGCSTGRVPQFTSGGPLALAFDHQALQVTDLAESAAFYADVLGLREIPEPSGLEIIRWFDLGNGQQLHLIALDEPQVISKATHFALAVHDLDAFLDHLRSNGVRYSDWAGTAGMVSDRADGVRQVYIQDPDEHWIEINTAH